MSRLPAALKPSGLFKPYFIPQIKQTMSTLEAQLNELQELILEGWEYSGYQTEDMAMDYACLLTGSKSEVLAECIEQFKAENEEMRKDLLED